MSYPARGPARSVGIDGQANAARRRRSSACVTTLDVEAAA